MSRQRADAGPHLGRGTTERSSTLPDSLADQVLGRMGLGTPTWKTLVVQASATTDGEPARVWPTWMNIEAWPQVSPQVSEAAWSSGDPWRPGSEFVEVDDLGFPLRKVRALQRVVAVDPGRSAEWASVGGGLRTARLWCLEPRAGGGTRISAVVVFHGTSIGVAKRFVADRWRAQLQTHLDGVVAMTRAHGPDQSERRDAQSQRRTTNGKAIHND